MSKAHLGLTPGQRELINKMAADKGIYDDWFQRHGVDNGNAAIFLEAVRLGKRITFAPEFGPPPGGRIHVLPRVPVVLDRDWQEAVNAAGPQTPDNYNVRKVGDLYLPTGTGVVEKEIILLNFGPQGGDWDRAIAWAKQFGLKRTAPRLVFAIGKHKPELHRELEMNPMYVVATHECTFEGYQQACDVWWGGHGPRACLSWVGYCGASDGWFAFSRE